MKRKKRLEKGISSINEQIRIHEEKLAKTKEENDEILEGYYGKEIKALKNTRDRKQNQIEKKV